MNIYETTDTTFASALLFYKAILLEIKDFGTTGRKTMVLDTRNMLYQPKDLKIMFESNQLSVDAYTFAKNLKFLKKKLNEHK